MIATADNTNMGHRDRPQIKIFLGRVILLKKGTCIRNCIKRKHFTVRAPVLEIALEGNLFTVRASVLEIALKGNILQ
jgi:hypothetical protein